MSMFSRLKDSLTGGGKNSSGNWLNTLVSGALDFTGAYIGNYWNRQDAKKAYERNMTSWLVNANYNSPAKQMERFKDAGLNPNLIYGQTNTAPLQSSTSPASPSSVPKLDLISAYQDLRQKDAMTQQIEAQTDLTNINKTRNAGLSVNDDVIHGILSNQEKTSFYQTKAAEIRYDILKKSLPAIYRQLHHQSGDWYNYWSGLKEMTSAILPLTSSVSNIGGLFPSEHVSTNIYRREY